MCFTRAKTHFDSDYMRGACPEIMRRLCETNLEQTPGYGADRYIRQAERRILEDCGIDDGRVFFLVGGTQTNATVIDGLLRRCQGVIAADTGHINVHESTPLPTSNSSSSPTQSSTPWASKPRSNCGDRVSPMPPPCASSPTGRPPTKKSPVSLPSSLKTYKPSP